MQGSDQLPEDWTKEHGILGAEPTREQRIEILTFSIQSRIAYRFIAMSGNKTQIAFLRSTETARTKFNCDPSSSLRDDTYADIENLHFTHSLYSLRTKDA